MKYMDPAFYTCSFTLLSHGIYISFQVAHLLNIQQPIGHLLSTVNSMPLAVLFSHLANMTRMTKMPSTNDSKYMFFRNSAGSNLS